MSFSLFSFSNFSNFLSVPIGKQSVMSKRDQEPTSQCDGETKTNFSSEGETCQLGVTQPVEREGQSSAGFGISRQSSECRRRTKNNHTGTRRFVGTTHSAEVEPHKWGDRKMPNSVSWKQERPGGTFELYGYNETCTGSDSKNRFSKHEYMTKIFHVLQKKLGITASCSTSSMEALKTYVLRCRKSMFSSTKAAIHLGRDYLANLVVTRTRILRTCRVRLIPHRNWYWNILKIFGMCIRLKAHRMDEIDIVSWSSDPVDTSKITCILRFPSVLGEDVGPKRCNYNMGRSSGRNSNVSYKHCCDRWRSSWIRVDYFGIFAIAESSRDTEWYAKTKHGKFKIGIIFMWVFNDIDRTTKGNDEICFSNSEKSRNTRKSSRKDTGRFSVLETNRTGVELFFTHVKENETLQPLKWCWESMQKKYWLHKERRWILYFKWQKVQQNCLEKTTNSKNSL